ncbi:hypothetical protein [Granulosicoccus antarcticus]|uniref:Transglycosylase SLT domain-containing protein n=1 Tax=Granulosicoccus antarcticus IMCC3135 TaxID=1192854 RepID=A0A2Z2NZM7_9GAMM|nr:hypothetical protein [Granulosicoccus antarcticus]ASJ75238.1 hypothetical protein IMCC3135_25915 [Granulosicoccus antarcticus IMCC3135]
MNCFIGLGRMPRIALLCLVVVFLQACATSQPREPENMCSVFKEKRGWHKAAREAEKKWGAPMYIPMAIIYQESTFRAKVKPARRKLMGFIPWRRLSSAYGYAQAIDGTWNQYLRSTGDYWRVRHDFADAMDFVQWYIRQASKRNGVSRNDAYSLYLNYHEGPGGFAKNTHGSKPWLQKVAIGVQTRSQKYREQYEQCKRSLKPGFFARILGW